MFEVIDHKENIEYDGVVFIWFSVSKRMVHENYKFITADGESKISKRAITNMGDASIETCKNCFLYFMSVFNSLALDEAGIIDLVLGRLCKCIREQKRGFVTNYLPVLLAPLYICPVCGFVHTSYILRDDVGYDLCVDKLFITARTKKLKQIIHNHDHVTNATMTYRRCTSCVNKGMTRLKFLKQRITNIKIAMREGYCIESESELREYIRFAETLTVKPQSAREKKKSAQRAAFRKLKRLSTKRAIKKSEIGFWRSLVGVSRISKIKNLEVEEHEEKNNGR